ncbi:VOC family protein [Actinomadura terrae]|uniref:VOC family protein n=1 Tax=Actinomadura terrae TaxID=604353 RepID=UPI001FA7AE4F|nr:VOC family protein [Actinomadura terrae]
MNITSVRLLTVPVSDQDAAKDFYAGTLGFEVVRDQAMGPVRWLQLAPAAR